jgi:NAD(P)H dehydrogenase (quinone)
LFLERPGDPEVNAVGNVFDDVILVTGATGKTGSLTVRSLRDRGRHVRALVRSLDHRADELRSMGAEVVHGDLLDFASVRAATAGVKSAYFNYPPGEGYIEAAVNFAQAATDAGVRAVVELSQIGVRHDTTHIGLEHWLVERLFDRTPLAVTHLRPTLFMNWLSNFWIRAGDDSGILRLPLADVRHAPITPEDQAQVIVAILQDPGPHAGQTYELFGAEELDWYEIAAKVQATLGISVLYQPIEIPTMTAALTAGGIDTKRVHHLGMVTQDYRDGFYSGSNDLVAKLTGDRPATVEQYVAATRDSFDTDGALAITDARIAGC